MSSPYIGPGQYRRTAQLGHLETVASIKKSESRIAELSEKNRNLDQKLKASNGRFSAILGAVLIQLETNRTSMEKSSDPKKMEVIGKIDSLVDQAKKIKTAIDENPDINKSKDISNFNQKYKELKQVITLKA